MAYSVKYTYLSSNQDKKKNDDPELLYFKKSGKIQSHLIMINVRLLKAVQMNPKLRLNRNCKKFQNSMIKSKFVKLATYQTFKELKHQTSSISPTNVSIDEIQTDILQSNS